MWGIFRKIMSIPQNIVMDLNNVSMFIPIVFSSHKHASWRIYRLKKKQGFWPTTPFVVYDRAPLLSCVAVFNWSLLCYLALYPMCLFIHLYTIPIVYCEVPHGILPLGKWILCGTSTLNSSSHLQYIVFYTIGNSNVRWGFRNGGIGGGSHSPIISWRGCVNYVDACLVVKG